MEQDPAGKSPYSYVKGIDYVNQVVEDSPTLLPGIGVLIDPARLRGSAIEKKNPYYIPMFGLRIYGKNPDDVINIAGKIDPTKFKPTSTVSFKKEQSTAVGEDPAPVKPGFFDRFKKKTPAKPNPASPAAPPAASPAASPAPSPGKAKKTRKGPPSKEEIAAAQAAKKAKQAPQTNNVDLQGFPSDNSNLYEAEPAPAPAKKGTPARSVNTGVIGQQAAKNTRSAKNKYKNKTAWMTNKNVNNEIDDLFKNTDAPVKKQAGMTAAEAIAAMKAKKAPNQATRNAAAGQKLLQARAARTPATTPATKQAKKGKAPPSQEAIAAARAAKAAKRDQEKLNSGEVISRTGNKPELSSNLFRGGSRKMRKPKRGARTFRKRRV